MWTGVLKVKTICAFFIVGTLSLTAACDSSQNPDKNTAAQNAPPPVSHTVFAPYVRELNKAKNVQNTINAQKQAMDKQIQMQSGATPAPASSS